MPGVPPPIVAYVVFAVFLMKPRGDAQGKPPEAPPKLEPTEPPEKTWADRLVEDDAKKIQERVRQISQRIEFRFAPGSDPYIDIITALCNASLFDLVSFGEITGHGLYAGTQLAGEPRMVVSVEPALLNIKHGDVGTLIVRQFLSTEVADTMWANRNRNVVIDFQSVAVPFKMLPFPAQRYRWWGPRFTIEEATRV